MANSEFLTGSEIRRTFLEFFRDREHTVVPSASLIPHDPALLLTVAGMVPFKPYLLGEETPPYPRAASSQKCIRTVDIDVVGTTARHLTFFEMLGNFSFGDYFKEKAIPWAYDLATEAFGLDPDRLWFTVHHSDDEAAEIWIDGVGVDPDRLQRRGDEDNFWQMGVAGPCGPSSEIFYDKGPEYGPDGGPVVDEERFMEFWNLVFMQNVQDVPYHVIGDLPAKNIDTGAGLDRVAALLQGVDTVFETDLMRPIMATGENASGVQYGADERSDVSLRILADHGRAATFLVADKVVPSNEGRGYILRRLVRRAVRHAALLGSDDLIMPRLVRATIDVMADAYPDVAAKQALITEILEREETGFRRTLASGHQLLDQALQGVKQGGTLPGAEAFKLHDTHGFPVELTEEILTERGFSLDRTEFETMMEAQRERARADFRGSGGVDYTEAYRTHLSRLDPTEFTGYEAESAVAVILSVLREGDSVERAETGQPVEVFLDRTPFYAESGGQIGDSGTLITETGVMRIDDTRFALPGIHGHRGVVVDGHIQPGQDAKLEIDSDRREHIRKNHTGTHILHYALRETLGEHTHQAGSLVEPERLRFDFSHFSALNPDEVEEVERLSNLRIIENARVTTTITTKEEAEAMGALAFFGDKYGDQVRVVSAGDYSVEFCGGTHVPTTGQVGPLLLVSEGSVAANTRRVEALTGTAAYAYLVDLRSQLRAAEGALRAQPGELVAAAGSAATRLKEAEERIAKYESEARTEAAKALADTAEKVGASSLVVGAVDGMAPDELRVLAAQVRDRLGSSAGVLASTRGGKVALVAFATPDLVDEGVLAGELLAPIAAIVGGGGSRDPQLAQAGGPHADRIADALEEARRALRTALG